MFALHYAPDLEQAIASISACLHAGGQFIAITVDERELLKRKKWSSSSWSNGLVTIEWADEVKTGRPPYSFTWGQGVDHCLQHVVPWKDLEKIAFVQGRMTCKLRHN